jgi:GNAT superfamily N-acetyltransferase
VTDSSDPQFLIRRAQPEDARMFQDMGEVSSATFDGLLQDARIWTERALASGEYIGWFGVPKSNPEAIAGGAGVQLRQVPPHPCRPARDETFAKGKHAIVINVFTEPEWRRRGLARLLMQEILQWARRERLDQLVLHASSDARRLYERMGFVAANEMRFEGALEVEHS